MKYERPLPSNSVLITTEWKSHPEFHNYEKELKKLGMAGILKFGEVSFLDVAHDDWCDIYNKDRCNCNPTIFDKINRKVLNPLKAAGK